MKMISTAEDVNTLAKQVPTTGGVYFVTAFSGLLAPYWDPGAAGMLIGTILIIFMQFIIHPFLRAILVHQPMPYSSRYPGGQRISNSRDRREHET
jgi:glycerol kinase